MARAIGFDGLCALAAGLTGYLIWAHWITQAGVRPPWWLMFLLAPFWIPVMLVARTYETRFLWVGLEEYRRIFHAAVLMLATVAATSWAFDLRGARGLVIVALPLTGLFTLVQRFGHRHWLYRRRRQGHFQQTTILVGRRTAVSAVGEVLQRVPYLGYRVIGCCLPSAQQSLGVDTFSGLPVLGGVDEVAEVVTRYEVDTVAVLPCPELDGPTLRSLGWQLEDTSAELLLAPAMTDVVGPRIHIRPVAGLPLLHMERPELTGVRRLTKGLMDRALALLGLVLLSPVIFAVALTIRATSSGPVLFRQERIGRGGETFTMWKFRTMVVNAHSMAKNLATTNDGNGVLFKLKKDPRVTHFGRILRRYSLDELPQLINVLRGQMSLVGPRPPLPEEVEHYNPGMHRRFLVKPGLTGLWQVSGRSDLSWNDSVRMDVQYVENWSLTLDLMILVKTLRAVLSGSGAY